MRRPLIVLVCCQRALSTAGHALHTHRRTQQRTTNYQQTKNTSQVSHPGDASNFASAAGIDDSAAGGAYRAKPYASKGDFAEF
jgi:hypothetical protein